MSRKVGLSSSSSGKKYWCPHDEKVWAIGEYQGEDKAKRTVKLAVKEDRTVNDYPIDSCILIEDHSVITEDVDDLTSLSQVNDATILNCSRIRFDKSVIYTSIGAVLMSINPFERIEGLYGRANIAKYHWKNRELNNGPHIYTTPAAAYNAMASFGKNQSLIISGESGAGKTEATKQCLDYLTKVSGSNSSQSQQGQEDDDDTISEIAHRIIAASPILEAFGNAQTVRNPNSSRFGKWMELSFNKHNEIVGSRITSYLLEKSRVTKHDPQERNYHVFYQIIRGADREFLSSLKLKESSTQFNYLCKGIDMEAQDFNDAENYAEMMEAFQVMGFDAETTTSTLKLVAAVLLLGNVSFESLDDGEACKVDENSLDSLQSFHAASELLGLDTTALGMAMTTRTIQSGGLRRSITTVRLNKQKASDTRDSLARCVYDKLFLDIIKKINANSGVKDLGGENNMKLIGLLDIFGFEIFEVNSFEQLCINYCNEMLQNHFTYVIFVAELRMYEEENISCDSIEYKDNGNIISLIETSFKALDEESKIPRGSSKTWFEKMKKANNTNSLDRKKGTNKEQNSTADDLLKFPTGHDAFTISHYAGPVSYVPNNFMEKNTEILSNDLVNAMMLSELVLVQEMFTPDPQPVSESPNRKGGGKSTTSSLSKNFQTQLKSLMAMLGNTESHFVKCIKSSSKCRPKDFEAALIHRQLLYSGVFEVVKIQQSGLPARMQNEVFNGRYRCLLPSENRWKDIVRDDVSILNTLREFYSENLPMVQVGTTKTFMKGKELRYLENMKEDVEQSSALKIQSWLLTCNLRRLYLSTRRVHGDLDQHVSNLQLRLAEDAVEVLEENLHIFSLLAKVDTLQYLAICGKNLVQNLIIQIRVLDDINEIMSKEGETLLTDDTADCLENSIAEAQNINFDHPSISAAKSAVKKFRNAKEAILLIESLSNNNNTSDDAMIGSHDMENEGKEELASEQDCSDIDLTSAQLSKILQSLGSYSNTLPGAADALAIANEKLNEIKVEMDSYIPRLREGLTSEMVQWNKRTGYIESTFDHSGSELSPLKEALAEIDSTKLRARECQVLYSGCEAFLNIKNVALSGNVHATLDHIKEFRQTVQTSLLQPNEPSPEFFQDLDQQFEMLEVWASEKLILDDILKVLAENCIDLSAHSKDRLGIVDVSALNELTSSITIKFCDGPSQTKLWLDFCKIVLRMRMMYNEKDWFALHEFIEKDYINDLKRMKEATGEMSSQLDVLKLLQDEHVNCRDISSFYLVYDQLLRASKHYVFSAFDIDDMKSSKVVLQSSISDHAEVLQKVKCLSRVCSDDCHILVEQLELSLHLREKFMEGDLGECKEIVKKLRCHPSLEILPKLSTELDCCSELVLIYEKEEQLRNNLKSAGICWSVFYNETENFTSIQVDCNDNTSVGIDDLEVTCDEVKRLPRCPKYLFQQSKDAMCVYDARVLSREIQKEDSFNGGPVIVPCIVGVTKPGRSKRHELATARNIRDCIDSFNTRIGACTTLYPENIVEVKTLLLDLQRRQLAYQFDELVTSCRSITGRVGHVLIDKELVGVSAKLLSNLSNSVSQFRSLLKSSEVTMLSISEMQKFHPSDKSRGFPSLFLSHLDPIISLSEHLVSLRDAVFRDYWKEVQVILGDIEEQTQSSNQQLTGNRIYLKALFNSKIAENDEIILIKLENDHKNLIVQLRGAISNLQVELTDKSANIQRFNPNPTTIYTTNLEKALSQAELIGCHSSESTELMKIVRSLISILTLLKESKRSEVSYDELCSIFNLVKKSNISEKQIFSIMIFIKKFQLVNKLYDAVKRSSKEDTKSLYMVIEDIKRSLNKNSNISDALFDEINPWLREIEQLRQLRLLRREQDWPSVIDLLNGQRASTNNHLDIGNDDLDLISFLEILRSEREHAYQEARANEASARLSIAKQCGTIGSVGSNSFYVPEAGIGMLKEMLDKSVSDQNNNLPEAALHQEQLSSLLMLRECALKESNVIKNENLRTHDASHLSVESPSVLAARTKTNDAVSKTSQFFPDECKFVSETSSLLQLIENLRGVLMKPVVTWERSFDNLDYSTGENADRIRLNSLDQTCNFFTDGRVEVGVENVNLQKKAVLDIRAAFPEKVGNIPLVTLTTTLHDILSTAEHISDYSVLEDRLRSFCILIEVLDIPEDVKNCLEDQVSVFQKGHLIDVMSSLVTEGSELLSSFCYDKTKFEAYIDKITSLSVSSGSGDIPEELLSCLNCMRCSYKLLCASDMLLTGDFEKYRKEMDNVSMHSPEWFYDILTTWISKLNDPSASTAAFMRDAERSLLARQESCVNSQLVSRQKYCGIYPGMVQLCLKEIGNYIQQMVKVKCNSQGLDGESVRKEFDDLHQPFEIWKERYFLLNLTWKGFASIVENYCMTDLHLSVFSLLISNPEMPLFHVDTATLKFVCPLLRISLEKEPHRNFAKGLSEIEKQFGAIVSLYESHVAQCNAKYNDKSKQLNLVELKWHFCNSIKDALQCMGQSLHVLELLAGIKWEKRIKDAKNTQHKGSYFDITANVKTARNISMSLYSSAKDWDVHVEGCPNFLLKACMSEGNKQKQYMSTLLGELMLSVATKAQLTFPLQYSHFSTQKKTLFLIKVFSKHDNETVVINYCDPVSDEQIQISLSLKTYSECKLDHSSLVRMIVMGAVELQKDWSEHAEPFLSASIQDALGLDNVCTGNVPFKQLIANASNAIQEHIGNLDFITRMLVASQPGYDLYRYSPWSFNWIDNYVTEKYIEVVSVDLTDENSMENRTAILHMLESHSYLKSQISKIYDSSPNSNSEGSPLNIFAHEAREQTHDSSESIENWISSGDSSESVWKFQRKVAQNSITRSVRSQGILFRLIELVQALVDSIIVPDMLSFLSVSVIHGDDELAFENRRESRHVHKLVQDFIISLSTHLMHPLSACVVLCAQELFFLSVIFQKVQGDIEVKENLGVLEMLSCGSYFVESFASQVNILISRVKSISAKYETSSAASTLINKLEEGVEVLICKFEGLYRLKLVNDGILHAVVNKRSVEISIPHGKNKKGEDNKSDACMDIFKTISASFKNKYGINNDEVGSKTFLKPFLPGEEVDKLKLMEGSFLRHLFRLRSISRYTDATGSEGDETNDNEEQDVMKEEAEILIPLSSVILQTQNLNVRSHLCKELGVVSLGNSMLDMNDKVSDIIALIKACGCDIRALRVGLHKKGLFDMHYEVQEKNLETAMDGATISDASRVENSSHFVQFLDVLNEVCGWFLSKTEDYVDLTSPHAPNLTRGELGKQVGMLYMNANFLGSLARPTSDLAPPKFTQRQSFQRKFSENSQASEVALPSDDSVQAVSPVHLLASRLMFMGYIKSHLAEIIQKIDSGNIHPIGRCGGDECVESVGVGDFPDVNDNCATNFRQDTIPNVPLEAEPFSWLSYDEDSVSLKDSKLRRSSSISRVRNAFSSPNYNITGLKGFYLDFRNIFNRFLAVRREFYQNLETSTIAKSVSFLSDLEDFFTTYFISELDEIVTLYESSQDADVDATLKEKDQDTLEKSTSADIGDEISDVVDEMAQDDVLSSLPKKQSPNRVVLSTKTILSYLCNNKDFNALISKRMEDLRLMSFLCLPEWVCGKQDMIAACRRMKQEVKYALRTSMINQYHKNLMEILNKHDGIFDEVVMASFDKCVEPTKLLSEIDGSYKCNEQESAASGHNLLHLWFSHRFDEASVNNGISLDAIIFEFLREDVFDCEESAKSFFEALDVDGKGVLSFRDIMDGALSNTFEERHILEKFMMKLRRRNSLRSSVSLNTATEEKNTDDEIVIMDDVHYVHEAFIQFYLTTVMAENHSLDNLIKAIPNLEDDEKLPPATAELVERAKMIVKIRNAANAGFFLSHNEQYSVEEFLDEWFDSIPEPDDHSGSLEVRAVYIATKNKVVRNLYISEVEAMLSRNDVDGSPINENKADEIEGMKEYLMNNDNSLDLYCNSLSKYHLTTNNLSHVLNSLFRSKEFACSDSSLICMREVAVINDLLIARENDLWESLSILFDRPTAISSDSSSIDCFFKDYLHEYRCQEYFKAAVEELHNLSHLELSLVPGAQPAVGSFNQDVSATIHDVDSTSRVGVVSAKVRDDERENESDEIVTDDKDGLVKANAPAFKRKYRRQYPEVHLADDYFSGQGLVVKVRAESLIGETQHRTIILSPPSESCDKLKTAVFDLIYQAAARKSNFVDKRLVLLYQFLHFLSLKDHDTAIGANFKDFSRIINLSEWLQMLPSDWSYLFPKSIETSGAAVESATKSSHFASMLRTTLALERRQYLQLWQQQTFKTVCDAVQSSDDIIIPLPSNEGNYDSDDEEAKAAAIRMSEFSNFNLVDVGKSTSIRTLELNKALAINLKKLLMPFAELYCIFVTNQYGKLYSEVPKSAIDRLNFTFNSDPSGRYIQESMRVINWILAGLPQDEEAHDEFEGNEEDGDNDDDNDTEEKCEQVGREEDKEEPPAPPTPLDLLSIAMQCNIPLEIKQQLTFCKLQCVNAVNKKFLIKELSKAADGELKVHLGRQQVFTDMAKAFTELSFILVEMENKEADSFLKSEYFMEDSTDDGGEQGYRNSVSDFELSESDDDATNIEHSIDRNISTPNSPTKRTSISNTMKEFKISTSDLVKAGYWILRLEMSILTEDWDKMDSIIEENALNPINIAECPNAISSFISLGYDIKAQNECLDKMEKYLYYSVSKVDTVQSLSAIDTNAPAEAKPFFYFVNFIALEPLVRETNTNSHMHVKSSEVEEKLRLCEFLIKVKAAIEAEKWFDNVAQNEKFVADLSIPQRKKVTEDVPPPKSRVALHVRKLELELQENELKKQKAENFHTIASVSSLLKNEKPDNLPRLIATEIQRIEREFQNQQVEICLVEAISQGQEYLKHYNLSLIQIADLEEVCDIASGMTQKSQRTMLLYNSAQKVMNLRRCLKAADWGGVRCWLSEPLDVAPESYNEINEIEKLSDMNLDMHLMLTNAIQSNCVSGTYMKLDTSNTNISMLLVAIRNASYVPKLSPEDRQICYTADCLKSIRLSILMSDYDTLIAEIMAVDIKDISPCALDEFMLVKKALNFFECMNKLRTCLSSSGPKGTVGNIDAQSISIYRLSSAIDSIDYKICSPSIQLFINHATVIKNIRSAFKGGRFGVSCLVECFILECIEKPVTELDDTQPLEHYVRHVRNMTYGREILGGVYISGTSVSEMTLDRAQGDMGHNENGISSILQIGLSNRSEQWKKRVYKDDAKINSMPKPYDDVPKRELYLSNLLMSPMLRRNDPDSVAAQLGHLLQHVLSESEDEILLARDELYNRVALNVLKRGLIRVDNASQHEKTRLKCMDIDTSPIEIDHAISIVQHLGIKTEAVLKLYHTALVVRKMRRHSNDIHKNDLSLTKVVEALEQIKSLKSNNLFAPLATAEIEHVFNKVCTKTVIQELTKALDQCLPHLRETEWKELDPEGFNNESRDLSKIIILRKALRVAAVNKDHQDADTLILRDMCNVLLDVIAAKNSGIHTKMIASHDQAERLASHVEAKLKESERIRKLNSLFNKNRRSADEIKEIDLPSLSKRLTKEIISHRRSMMEVRYSSASSTSDNPLLLVQRRRSSGGRVPKRRSVDNSDIPNRQDYSKMNSLQLYDAAEETKSSSIVNTSQNLANIATHYPPFFHGEKVDHIEEETTARKTLHDVKVVDMIRSVVASHVDALQPSAYYKSPKKIKDEKHKMSSFVRVSLRGDFKTHLEAISKNAFGKYSAIQKMTATILVTLLKFPRVVKVSSATAESTPISVKLLESAMKLLTRNEKSSFIAGASVEPDTSTIDSQKSTRRYDLASSWRRSEDGNFDGYEEKRSEIKVKSQHAFHVAITIGEFIELGLREICSRYSPNIADRKLAETRLTFMESYFEKELSEYLSPSFKTKFDYNESKPNMPVMADNSVAQKESHPIYPLVLSKITSLKTRFELNRTQEV